EKVEDGYYVKSTNAVFGEKAQYLEYYGGYFTCYGMGNDTSIYTFQFYKVESGEDAPVEPEEPDENTAEYTETVANGDKVIIFNRANGKAVGVEGYTYTNKSGKSKDELVAVDGTVDGTVLTYGEGTAIFEVSIDADGHYTFVSQDGKYFYLDGTNVRLVNEAGNYTLFDFEKVEDGYYVKSTNAVFGEKAQYLEYYGGYFTCYGMGNDTSIYTFQFYKVESGKEIPDGDYVIWAPAYKKALSAQKTGYNNYYNAGVDVTLSGEKLTGYGETEIWTVTNNEDGTITIANGGKKLSMATSNSSMTMDAVNDKWEVIALGNELYNVKNVGRGNFMEWYAEKGNWSTYGSSSAATDGQFQLMFTPAEEIEDTSVLPAEGDKVVIYNLSAKGVLAEESDTKSINGVLAEIVEGKAVPETARLLSLFPKTANTSVSITKLMAISAPTAPATTLSIPWKLLTMQNGSLLPVKKADITLKAKPQNITANTASSLNIMLTAIKLTACIT
ncbi:MAG: hypothetical protein IJA06_01840, partial [Oscillospiraceae bacterium]|nr:hypothetical protein [Oscillospiraceae bacterium]